ncbi:MAG TPA: hypothetical protein VMT89_14900, partial [Candidatus Acidoferrales bacterium]|nr:hypothetical protein [Candidatus Acidoferrales bacterium]
MQHLARAIVAVVFSVAVALLQTAQADTKTWAGSIDASWSNAGNWAGGVPSTGDRLSFFNAPGTRTSSNDLAAGIVYQDISFLDSGYTLNGNGIGLSDGISGFGSGNTINLPIQLQASQSFSAYLSLNGGIDLQSYTLTLGAYNNSVNIGGGISGSGGIIIMRSYDTISGVNTYSGPTQ